MTARAHVISSISRRATTSPTVDLLEFKKRLNCFQTRKCYVTKRDRLDVEAAEEGNGDDRCRGEVKAVVEAEDASEAMEEEETSKLRS